MKNESERTNVRTVLCERTYRIVSFVTDPFLFTEAVGEDQAFASPFGCCIQEVLLCCHQSLSEECIAARLSLAQRLETTLHILTTATDGTGRHSNHVFIDEIKFKKTTLVCHVMSCLGALLHVFHDCFVITSK